MRIIDIIDKKKNGLELTKEEIEFVVNGYTNLEIPDYQMSALLMAIFLKGMTDEETGLLTMAMANSGDMLDLSQIEGIKVDKHSTGGVGDKTTMIVTPLVAACGVNVAKMSGRALGFSGGTVDKLESFAGINLRPSVDDFIKQVNEIHVGLIAQTGDLAPADKKIYALRDATGTVENMSLIASSIMSKKIASGCDKVIIDVKVGSGAFMKTLEDARRLATIMTNIGKNLNREIVCVLTNMDVPLGVKVGNILEVKEAIEVLKNEGPEDITEVSVCLAANMVMVGLGISYEEAENLVREKIADKTALLKFRQLIEYEGGDVRYIDNPELFEEAKFKVNIFAPKTGYIKSVHTNEIGRASMLLGAGRETKEDEIDFTCGLEIFKKTSDFVNEGEVIACLHTNKDEKINEATKVLLDAYVIQDEKVEVPELIHEIIK